MPQRGCACSFHAALTLLLASSLPKQNLWVGSKSPNLCSVCNAPKHVVSGMMQKHHHKSWSSVSELMRQGCALFPHTMCTLMHKHSYVHMLQQELSLVCGLSPQYRAFQGSVAIADQLHSSYPRRQHKVGGTVSTCNLCKCFYDNWVLCVCRMLTAHQHLLRHGSSKH